jgi:hypothetical protein
MNPKSTILGIYLLALFIILRHWYNQPGNSGMPYPTAITAPSYLYAVLGIASGIVGNIATVLAVGLTLGLYYRTHQGKPPIVIQTGPSGTKATITPHKVPYQTPAPTKPGANR